MNYVEANQTISRIRELIKKNGVNKTAKLVGRSVSGISHIKTGRRHARTGAVLVNDLELRRVPGGKICRCCGNKKTLFTRTHRCVECELLELGKTGTIKIEETI